MHAGRHLARGIQARHRRGGSVRVDADASHDVVKRRTDLHRLLRDVDVRELLELVVHRRQPALDVLGGAPRRDVEIHAAVRSPAPGLHLGVDRAGDLVARQEVRGAAVVLLVVVPGVGLALVVGRFGAEELRDVIEHEALPLAVLERAAVTAHAFGHEEAAHARWPDHPRRMELDHLHVDEVRAGVEGHRDPVAGVLPRVRRDLPALPHASGREDDRPRAEEHELPGLAPVAERARDLAAVGQQPLERALHVHVDPLVDGVLLQRADHLEAGAVTHVREPRVAVTAEVALEDEPVLRAIEERAPLLELEHPVRRFLRVQLGHPPVVEELSATHGVAEVDPPVVLFPDVPERRRDPALGHHGVGLAEERLADQRRARTLGRGFDRRAQARPTRADHDHVVVVSLQSFLAHLRRSTADRRSRPRRRGGCRDR